MPYCTKCGLQNEENNFRCTHCGETLVHPEVIGDPGLGPASPGLAWAIVVTILCCWPLGIPAIVYAAKAMSFNGSGHYAEAHNAARQARTWSWIAFGLGLLVSGGYFLLVVGGAMAGSMP